MGGHHQWDIIGLVVDCWLYRDKLGNIEYDTANKNIYKLYKPLSKHIVFAKFQKNAIALGAGKGPE